MQNTVKISFLVSMVFLLTSCDRISGFFQKKENTSHAQVKDPLEDSFKVFKGRYVYGHEVSSFQACNDTKSYWVAYYLDYSEPIAKLEEEYLKLTKDAKEPYQEVYVELTAYQGPRANEGFAEGYDGLMLMKSYQKIEKLDKQCE